MNPQFHNSVAMCVYILTREPLFLTVVDNSPSAKNRSCETIHYSGACDCQQILCHHTDQLSRTLTHYLIIFLPVITCSPTPPLGDRVLAFCHIKSFFYLLFMAEPTIQANVHVFSGLHTYIHIHGCIMASNITGNVRVDACACVFVDIGWCEAPCLLS